MPRIFLPAFLFQRFPINAVATEDRREAAEGD